jgi:hypothetical protein
MVTAPDIPEYRTRLIDLLGPDAALAASLYSCLVDVEKAGIFPRTILFPVEIITAFS